MTSFPNDNLNPDLCGGDLLLQICAGRPDTAIHALRDIAKHTRDAIQINWRMDGFVSPARPAGVPRNHLGFMDGIANPNVTDPEVANRLMWVVPGIGEPDWALGGTYHVCRIIRMFIEFWDRVSLGEQQTMIGRYRASGNVLGTTSLTALPDYAADPNGNIIPLIAHIRLANPRTTGTEDSRIFRRGYNYDNGADLAGNLDMGLIFNCFQQNLARQFIANQTRLIGEPMVDYISPVGGGTSSPSPAYATPATGTRAPCSSVRPRMRPDPLVRRGATRDRGIRRAGERKRDRAGSGRQLRRGGRVCRPIARSHTASVMRSSPVHVFRL